MAAVPALLLTSAAFFAACVAAQGVAYGPGMGADWAQPTIPNLRDAEYLTRDVLYGRYNASSGKWTNLRLNSSADHDADEVAVAEVLRNSDAEGWDVIKVRSLDTRDEFYTAGYAEGLATYESICNNWYNIARPLRSKETPFVHHFIREQVQYTRNLPPTTAFNRQALSILRQVDGLYDGWATANEAAGFPAFVDSFSWNGMYLLSFAEEFEAVTAAEPNIPQARSSRVESPRRAVHSRHCHCALLVNGSELYIGHAAQDDYNSMLRQWKTYEFQHLGSLTFSSYPGFVFSSDDFIASSAGILMVSTSLLNYNDDLARMVSSNSVPGFIQSTAAMYLSTTPQEFAELWGSRNSGTLSAQTMVIDLRASQSALDAGRPLPDDAFVMCENYPTLTVCQNMSWWLNGGRPWLSFDSPYFNATRNISGSNDPENQELEMGWIAWPSSVAPPLIRDMQYVTDVTTMFYAIRHNNYPHDPMLVIPKCKRARTKWSTFNCSDDPYKYTSPVLTNGARQDLVPDFKNMTGVPADDYLALAFGSIDGKVSSARMLQHLPEATVIIQHGPTTVQQRPFSFAHFNATHPKAVDKPRRGLPDTFDFHPVMVRPLSSRQMRAATSGSAPVGVAVAAAVVCGAAIVGVFVVVRHRRAHRRRQVDEATGLL